MTDIELNGDVIELEMQWLQSVIKNRINEYFQNNDGQHPEPLPPEIFESGTYYAEFLNKYELSEDERKVVLLALAPEVKPEILDVFFVHDNMDKRSFAEFGGIISKTFTGFLPTLKTAYFVLGGNSLSKQIRCAKVFEKGQKLFRENILKEITVTETDPGINKNLCLSDEAINAMLTGKDIEYEYSYDFPANKLETELDWDDLVLSKTTFQSLKELIAWSTHGHKLVNELNMSKNIQLGYRALFYGPSGTGKTLSAALVGKKVGKPVYRIDLSQLVSKYIGETEKNLEKIFKVAGSRDWILFFDEADALFGKRTSVNSSNDRFANQETAYLLQRIETCSNMVILASNLKKNMDEAFTRRFQSIVYFPAPKKDERLQLWTNVFTNEVVLDDAIDLAKISEKYDLSGGSIVNVARYVSLMALSRDTVFISQKDLLDGIQRELTKHGRTP